MYCSWVQSHVSIAKILISFAKYDLFLCYGKLFSQTKLDSKIMFWSFNNFMFYLDLSLHVHSVDS